MYILNLTIYYLDVVIFAFCWNVLVTAFDGGGVSAL